MYLPLKIQILQLARHVIVFTEGFYTKNSRWIPLGWDFGA